MNSLNAIDRLTALFSKANPVPFARMRAGTAPSFALSRSPRTCAYIEESREFRGRFHVLGGLIAPLEGVNPGDLSTAKLIARIRSGGVGEVILALNPTVEGDTTALYLQNLLKDPGVEVSRLATGMPVGGDLEYLDCLTLSRSLRGRVRLETARD